MQSRRGPKHSESTQTLTLCAVLPNCATTRQAQRVVFALRGNKRFGNRSWRDLEDVTTFEPNTFGRRHDFGRPVKIISLMQLTQALIPKASWVHQANCCSLHDTPKYHHSDHSWRSPSRPCRVSSATQTCRQLWKVSSYVGSEVQRIPEIPLFPAWRVVSNAICFHGGRHSCEASCLIPCLFSSLTKLWHWHRAQIHQESSPLRQLCAWRLYGCLAVEF